MRRRPNRATYGGLSGGERFRLMLEAQDRGDGSEHEYLLATCSQVRAEYREPEPGFLRTAEAAATLARALATGAGPTVGWLSLLEVLREPCRRLVGLLAGSPEEGEEPTERFPILVMQAAHTQALVIMKGMLGGFGAVCEEVSLDPEVVLRVLASHLAQALGPYRGEIEEAPTDPELLALCTEELRGVWEAAFWGATGERPRQSGVEQRREP